MWDCLSAITPYFPSADTALKILQGLFYILSVTVSIIALITARKTLEHNQLIAERDKPRVNVVAAFLDDTEFNGTGQFSLTTYNDGQRPTSITNIRVTKPGSNSKALSIPKDEGRLEPGGYYAKDYIASEFEYYWRTFAELKTCKLEVEDVTGKWHQPLTQEQVNLPNESTGT
ncbi:hypothetical protein ACMG4P_04750 [Pseudovibrio denitrificans]|uniref:hypothetical protein n=1 Tax=Pseudovibrio denitrificans TaxID=258256 RepID=UPI0039BFACE3